MTTSQGRPQCVLVLAVLCAGLAGAAEVPETIGPSGSRDHESKTEINKNLTDPISTTWSLKLQNNIDFVDVTGHGDQVEDTVTFQPTLPVILTRELKLIVRPEFTLLDAKPFANSQGALQRTTGVGDTILDVVLAPISDPWLIGLGPTFVFPTANLDETGQGKWQMGPASVLGYRSKIWLAALIAQQWWSFAGSPDRPAVSELHLQYLASYFFGHGWSVGTAPTIKVDWRAKAGNQVTFPIGPSIAKVVKFGDALPVKFGLRGMYVPVYPDSNGERFIIQLIVDPAIPSIIAGPLFGG